MIRNPVVSGEHRGPLRTRSVDYHVEQNNNQSGSKVTEDGTTDKAMTMMIKV